MTAILLALTSHDDLGGRRPTGFYVPEAAHAWRTFTDAGFAVTLTSPAGGRPPMDGYDATDPVQHEFAHLPALNTTHRTSDITPGTHDAIFFVGGHGAMWDFPTDPALAHLGRTIHESGGVVASVCHGAAALVNLTLSDGTYLVANKEVTSFTNTEEEAVQLTDAVPFLLQTALEGRGAQHVAAPNFTAQVCVSHRVVTGQNPASTQPTAEAVAQALAKVKA